MNNKFEELKTPSFTQKLLIEIGSAKDKESRRDLYREAGIEPFSGEEHKVKIEGFDEPQFIFIEDDLSFKWRPTGIQSEDTIEEDFS